MAKFIKGDVVVIPFPNIRPNRLFTADSHIILYRVGHIKNDKLNQVIEKLVEIIKG